MTARDALVAARPAQVLKSLPVLAPLVFGHRTHDAGAVAATLAAWCGFAAVAAAGYLANDVVDRADDAAHPVKRTRPVAAGRLSPRAALATAAGLFVAGVAVVAVRAPAATLLPLGGYAASTALYTLLAKPTRGGPPLVAAGFVLRVLGGAAAAEVAPSPWLLALTAALAFALALGKREAERRRRDGEAPAALQRATDAMFLLAGAGYVAYTLAPGTVALHGTRALVITAAPVLGALARVRALLRRDRTGAGPADLVARDPLALGLGVLWAGLCVALLP